MGPIAGIWHCATLPALLALLDVEQGGARLNLDAQDGKGGVSIFGGENADGDGRITIANRSGDVVLEMWATERGGEMTFHDPQSGELVAVLPDGLRD